MKDIINEVVKFQTLTELYKSKAITEFQKALVRSMERISKELLDFPSEFSLSKLNGLKREITSLIKKQYEPFIDNLLDDNWDIVNMAYGVYAGSLADEFVSIPKTAVERILNPNNHLLGQTLKEITTSLTAKQTDYYKKTIADGMINGFNAETVSKQLREYNDGTLRNNINAIVRTSFQSAMQEAYNEAVKQNNTDISYAFSLGTLDSRTSPVCQEQTGKSVKRNKGENISSFISRAKSYLIATPRHVNCRSKIIFESTETFNQRKDNERPAVIDADKKTVKHRDGTTSTKYTNKEVEFYSQDVTYDEFFKQQSDAFKIEVLGKAKFDLYSKGNLKVSSLRDLSSNTWLTNDKIMDLL